MDRTRIRPDPLPAAQTGYFGAGRELIPEISINVFLPHLK